MKRDLLLSLLVMLCAGPLFAEASRVVLAGHVPAQTQSMTRIAPAPPGDTLNVGLVVQVDPERMRQTLNSLYGAHSTTPRQFLSSADFAKQFNLPEKRAILKSFAQANGLQVAADDHPDSLVVKVSGRAELIAQSFGVSLSQYRDQRGRVIRAPDTNPTVPSAVAPHLKGIVGLSDIPLPIRPSVRGGAISGAGVHGLTPANIKTIYGLNGVTQDGTGQTIALYEFNGFDPSDIATYQATFGLPANAPIFVSVDGAANLCDGVACGADPTPSNEVKEVALDIEMALALAPQARILVYTGPVSVQGALDIFDRIASDNQAQVVSTSWGASEKETEAAVAGYIAQESQIFERMAVQGQTVFAASGDTGAFGAAKNGDLTSLTVYDPASQPYVTGVGGTTLSGSVSAPVETAWNNMPPATGGSSGGGVSMMWPIPNYQVGVPGLASTQNRNVPDVSLNADITFSSYSFFVAGNWHPGGGTSAAAPLWAAFTALVNQERQAAGKGNLGFANPTFYQLGTKTASSSLFNDITSGTNGYYSTGPGYDNVTGLGSFKGNALRAALNATVVLSTSTGLSNVYAYPNPWDTRRHSVKRMTFANLPDGAGVKIFTLSGFLVKKLTASNARVIWDLSNDAGDTVASGLYFYLATSGSDHTSGQVAIIK